MLVSIVFLGVMLSIFFTIIAWISGHSFGVGRITFFALEDFRYTFRDKISLSIQKIVLSFYIPSKSSARWLSISASGIEFKDSHHHLSLAQKHTDFLFFPLVYKHSAGPLLNVDLDDFRVIIYTSEFTPAWIEKMRNNLTCAVVIGETIQLDDMKTEMNLDTNIADRGQETDGKEKSESRVSIHAENWFIVQELIERMYSFGKLDMQLRRNWAPRPGGGGVLAIIASSCRWIKLLPPGDSPDRGCWW
jgi:hypothetical protein